jgi:hypothetical protein
MRKTPTDLEILDLIYNDYYRTYLNFNKDNPQRETKIYVPIDIDKIANTLNVDNDIIFGRLYYHLNYKYSYKKDGVTVPFFQDVILGANKAPGKITTIVKKEIHAINFPYMASVLATLRDEDRKFRTATWIAAISAGISLVSILISIIALAKD